MAAKKAYDKSAKASALWLWGATSFVLLAVLLVPLYLYWDKIAARPTVLAVILGLLAYAIFCWARLAATIARGIRNLPEQ